MPTLSPTQKTKSRFEKLGYIVATVERVNSWAGPPDKKCPACGKNTIGIRQDLFGFADLIAFHPDDHDVLLIQCTTSKNHATRRTKIMASKIAPIWAKSENRKICVVSFKGKKEKVEFVEFDQDEF